MDEKEQSVMVALLPFDNQLPEVESPHLTIVYCGEVPELTDQTLIFLNKIASSLAILSKPISLKSTGVEVFGEEEKVNVIRLISNPQLLAIRSFFEDWDNNEFPVYKPHVTIGPVGEKLYRIPMILKFDRILVSWGEQRFIYTFIS